MPTAVPCSSLLVIGVGNPLRGDDGVGLVLVRRLQAHFGSRLSTLEMMAPDVAWAERIAACRELLVIDAAADAAAAPFGLVDVAAASSPLPAGGWVSHRFDWPAILTLARQVYGRAPRTRLLAVCGVDFGIRESLSAACRQNAEAAFAFLVDTIGAIIDPR